jgi:hypothetical protein
MERLNNPGKEKEYPIKKYGAPDVAETFIAQYKVDGKVVRQETFTDGSFIEIKGTSQKIIDYNYDNYQPASALDLLKYSRTAATGEITRLTYVTTSDSVLGARLQREAFLNKTALYRAIVYESCTSLGSIKVGSTTGFAQNEILFKGREILRGINTKRPVRDTYTQSVPSDYVKFRP